MLMGPSQILKLPKNNNFLIVFGLFLFGIANVLCFSTVPAEAAEEV